MESTRRCGILLHPTSLPGPYGAGDFGADAYHFADWLASARQSFWQMLPLCDIGTGNSPYMSPSAFAGNIFLIGLDTLCNAGWLKKEELIPDNAFDRYRVHYPTVSAFRMSRLKLASGRFFGSADTAARHAFELFCEQSAFWLDNYALFRTLNDSYGATWQRLARTLRPKKPRSTGQLCRRTRCRYPVLEILPVVFLRTMASLAYLCPFKRHRHYRRHPDFRLFKQRRRLGTPRTVRSGFLGIPAHRRRRPSRPVQRQRTTLGQPPV